MIMEMELNLDFKVEKSLGDKIWNILGNQIAIKLNTLG